MTKTAATQNMACYQAMTPQQNTPNTESLFFLRNRLWFMIMSSSGKARLSNKSPQFTLQNIIISEGTE